MEEIRTNCPNCGAPLTGNKCKYCGTESIQIKTEVKYYYMGKEIENPTEEMLCDPKLLVTFA